MSEPRWQRLSERWFRLLLRLYPADFRDEMGEALVETYRERCRASWQRKGGFGLVGTCARATLDAVWNGAGERLHPAVSWRRSGNWGRDIELASRRLVRAPVFLVATVGTLMVGLGAFAVVYTAVHKILLEPLAYEAPDDLYYVWRDYSSVFDLKRGWLAGTDVAALQRSGGVIEDAAGLLQSRFTLGNAGAGDPTEIVVMMTSPNLFELLGVQPMLGRGFAPNEVGPDRAPVIVLTHGLWTRLGGERSILGRELRLNGQPFTVIGVMPREFAFVRHTSLVKPQAPDAYIPLTMHLAETNPNNGSFGGLVRVRRGTPPPQVTAAVSAVGRMIDERDFSRIGLKLYPVRLHEDLVAGVRPALVVVALAGVFLVLVLMVNLATLLLARATQREREFAVSRALGANPVAVMRATLVEGGALGLLGGLAAALAAVWGTRVLVSLAPMELPRREAIAVDWVVAAIVIGVGVLLGLMAALVPALWAARTPLAALLGHAAVRGGGGHGRMRRSMVVVQVALSLVLLSAGGLVVRSFERLLRADAGFRPEGLLAMRVPIPAQLIPDSLAALALQDRVHDALAAIPGVSGVSAADALPLSGGANQTSIEIPGAPGNTGQREHDRTLVDYIGVRAGYSDVMGMRVVSGRPLHPMRRTGRFEAVIDRRLADYFFPTGSPLGAKIPFGDPDTLTIVGVVEQARLYDVHRDDRPQVYIRAEDWGYRTLSFVVRSGRSPTSLMAEARAAIRSVDPRLALSDIRTGDDIVNDALRQQRTSAVLIAGFSLGALLLAAMGVFGVVAASVTRRRQEIAVRLALGAEHRRVLRLLIGEGARLVLLGVLIGVPGAYYAGRAIRGLLVGIAPSDPLTFTVVGLLLGLVALMACYLPARRVLGIEPARSLRGE